MAIKITPQGGFSFDPLEEIKTKIKGTGKTSYGSERETCSAGYHWDSETNKCVKDVQPIEKAEIPSPSGKHELGGVPISEAEWNVVRNVMGSAKPSARGIITERLKSIPEFQELYASTSGEVAKAGKAKEEEMSVLEEKQALEQQQLREELPSQEQLGIRERDIAAGASTIGAVFAALGIADERAMRVMTAEEMAGLSEKAKNELINVGKIATFGFKGFSLSKLIDTSGNLGNMRGDARAALKLSNAQLAYALTRSANRPRSNTQEALLNCIQQEEAIRMSYNQAITALSTSPEDVRDGLDLTEEMRTALGMAMQNRQMVERFALTNDPTELLGAIGGQVNLADFE